MLKNATANIYRYRTRYILFGVLYFILVLVASVSMVVFVRINQVTGNFFREYASVVRVSLTERTGPNTFERRGLTLDEYLALTQYDFFSDVSVAGFNFDVAASYNYAQMSVQLSTEVGQYTIQEQYRFCPVFARYRYITPRVFVRGVNPHFIHLTNHNFDFEDGRMFANDFEAVIRRHAPDYRDYNGWDSLGVGDTILIQSDCDFQIYKEFTIVGILVSDYNDDRYINRKVVYTTMDTALAFYPALYMTELFRLTIDSNFNRFDAHSGFMSGYDVFVHLSSPEDFQRLRNEMFRTSGDISHLHIEPLVQNVNQMISLVSTTIHTTETFMVIFGFLIICIAIISTLLQLSGRKYDIAVLRSMGETKLRIIVSYALESLIFVWSICLLAVIPAYFIASPLANHTIEDMRQFMSAENFAAITQESNVLTSSIGYVLIGSLIVVTISSVIACINTVRFEPLKIFNKRY